MDTLDIFRLNPDRSFSWISSADSLYTARKIIAARAVDPSEEFLIYDHGTNEKIRLRGNNAAVTFALADFRSVALQSD